MNGLGQKLNPAFKSNSFKNIQANHIQNPNSEKVNQNNENSPLTQLYQNLSTGQYLKKPQDSIQKKEIQNEYNKEKNEDQRASLQSMRRMTDVHIVAPLMNGESKFPKPEVEFL